MRCSSWLAMRWARGMKRTVTTRAENSVEDIGQSRAFDFFGSSTRFARRRRLEDESIYHHVIKTNVVLSRNKTNVVLSRESKTDRGAMMGERRRRSRGAFVARIYITTLPSKITTLNRK